MKTTWAKAGKYDQKWVLYNAENRILGRLASDIAMVLMGKEKPIYTPFIDTGDYVVVINADKIAVTGKKSDQKKYYSYSGYFGGIKERTFKDYVDKKSSEVIYLAVKRMLPKTKMGRQMLTKLKVYSGSAHPHEAQKPVLVEKGD